MNKLIAVATAITCAIILACASVIPACAEEKSYDIFAVVIDFNYNDDTFDLLDEEGNIWTLYGIEDWFIGDKAILTIWKDNNQVIDIDYIGWWDIFELSHFVIDVCGE